MTEIAGRTAVVTGAAHGIGRALALALAEEGASVVVSDIVADRAEATAEEIRKAGGAAASAPCDVADRASVAALKTQAQKAFGPVSLLFANAGVTAFERMDEMSGDDIDWLIDVDLKGVANCIMAFYPDMAAARDGHVAATASMAGLLPGWIPYHAPYSGAKLGVVGLMLNFAIEAAERGVGVTAICPGGYATGMGERNYHTRPGRYGGPADKAVTPPDGFFSGVKLELRPPEEFARIILEGVRKNRPLVLSDTTEGRIMRKVFRETYAGMVERAFDDFEEFEETGEMREG